MGCGAAKAEAPPVPVIREAFVVGGTGNGTPSDQMMYQLFEQGIIIDPNPVGVTYPADIWPLRGELTLDQSVAVGVANLGAALAESSGPVVVVGISQGAVVVNYEKSALVAQADPHPPQDLVFVTIGDPTNRDGGILAKLPHFRIPILDATIPKAPVETPYDTIEIVHEYDGYADFPDNPFNLLAVLNAVAGIIYEHPNKSGVDLSDPRNIVTISTNSLGGTTTHILVPTDDLPLTRPLRSLGIPDKYVDEVDVPLRWIINTGYSGERPGMTDAQTRVESVSGDRAERVSAPHQLLTADAVSQGDSADDTSAIESNLTADSDGPNAANTDDATAADADADAGAAGAAEAAGEATGTADDAGADDADADADGTGEATGTADADDDDTDADGDDADGRPRLLPQR
ncbi:PE-PPE domain-containing protein [Mycolicibacterium austroafricanum]|uniref:PE-PPE domain-containing protein n=1 Tax=Mycolicibacterium austroafricanum TaxID=39687 RepID=UPI00197C73D6|nr:PE-PPE domain-containing protein [Mycolicibacterium austroafricanum]